MNRTNIIKIFITFTVTLLAMTLINFNPIKDKPKTDVNVILDLPNMSDLIDDEVKKIKEEQAHTEKLEELERQKHEESRKKHTVSRGVDKGVFTATAYDLSVASCGKSESHPAYGITANGTNLRGHTLESAKAIAVDPKVIKLGSKVHIEFLDEEYKHLNGEYTAVDTGGAIKGKIIDVFLGSGDVTEEVKQFGRRKVKIKVINK